MAVKRRASEAVPEDLTDPGPEPVFDEPETHEGTAPSDEEHDPTPETVVPPTELDLMRVTRLLTKLRDLALGHVASFLVPIGVLAAQGLVDGLVAGRAWWVLVMAGFVRGASLTVLFEWAARTVDPQRPRFQGLSWVGPTVVLSSTLLSWNLTGALLCLVLLFVPWLDASLARETPVEGLKLTWSVLSKSALTWLAAQGALMLLGVLGWLLVSAVGDALVGELLSGVLSGVVLAPLVHGWLLVRALWVRD
jgi:hypothetical protein